MLYITSTDCRNCHSSKRMSALCSASTCALLSHRDLVPGAIMSNNKLIFNLMINYNYTAIMYTNIICHIM